MNEPLVVTAPAVTPVSLDEVKAHLRVDSDTEDALIAAMIAGAAGSAELYLGRSLITQTLRLTLDRWPVNGTGRGVRFDGPWLNGPRLIELARPPVQSIASVTVYDDDDQASTVDPSVYRLANGSNDRARLVLRKGQAWPTGARIADAIEIAYGAGYGDAGADVPEPIRQGILALVAFWFEHRDGAGWALDSPPLPVGAVTLWRPFRLIGLAR
jgi:uncharacterized phiE125 gp8 family phage protein